MSAILAVRILTVYTEALMVSVPYTVQMFSATPYFLKAECPSVGSFCHRESKQYAHMKGRAGVGSLKLIARSS